MPAFSRPNNADSSHKALAEEFEAQMPDAAFARARNEHYASVGTPVIDRARLFVLSVILGVIGIILGVALIILLPLKKTEPYVFTVDNVRGIVSTDAKEVRRAADYTPERPVLERELFQFVERLYAMNADYPKGVQEGHIAAYAYTRGRATQEFREWMASEQPYQRQQVSKGLIRTVEKKTLSFQEDGKLVLIRFKTLEREETRPAAIAREWLMTVQFTRDQQGTTADLDRNPLGIYITHFEIVEER